VQLQRRLAGTLGATGRVWPPRDGAAPPPADVLKLAVVGAHLSGMPLNHQLTDLGGKLVRACKTAPRYRLFELPDSDPPKPGLVRALDRGGLAIEVEVWSLPRATLGTFFANVRAPLCLGTVELDDGERVTGFLCEAYATGGAKEISGFGGWRRYLASKA
jgi:allophanate hydrolase